MKVSLKAQAAALRRLSWSSQENIKKAFALFDIDKDGEIDINEFKYAFPCDETIDDQRKDDITSIEINMIIVPLRLFPLVQIMASKPKYRYPGYPATQTGP